MGSVHGRTVELAALAAAVCWLVAPVRGAPDYDGRYAGIIACDAIPGQTVQSLKTDFSMKVANGQAEYEREVLRPSGGSRLGVTERGSGTVSASGEVSLTGSAAGQT